jgi:hypothetical protein
MRHWSLRLVVPAAAVILVAGVVSRSAEKGEPHVAHIVFFTLKEQTAEARQKLVASCQKYLAKQEGALHFAVGTIAGDLKEPVSDRDFDVALHLVFKDKAAEGRYLVHPDHKTFVEENKDSWSRVRVFDSYLAEGAH